MGCPVIKFNQLCHCNEFVQIIYGNWKIIATSLFQETVNSCLGLDGVSFCLVLMGVATLEFTWLSEKCLAWKSTKWLLPGNVCVALHFLGSKCAVCLLICSIVKAGSSIQSNPVFWNRLNIFGALPWPKR